MCLDVFPISYIGELVNSNSWTGFFKLNAALMHISTCHPSLGEPKENKNVAFPVQAHKHKRTRDALLNFKVDFLAAPWPPGHASTVRSQFAIHADGGLN
jgi:hypothetical protein